MAVAAYFTWDRAGRPLSPAQPVVDVIARMKAAYPQAAGSFSYYADASHLQAAVPQDHTPYSTDGYPVPCQRWWVYATDIMHDPAAGVDCNLLFPYWLAEAKAGRFPGLKYLIWQAHIYDVRHGWQQQASAGHFDHIHLSFRTDWQTRGLGSWSLLPTTQPQPQGDDDVLYLVNILVSGTAPDQKNLTGLTNGDGSWHHIAKGEALDWVKANVAPKDLGTMWDWEAYDRFGIGDPAELQAIKQAAGAGVAAAVPAIVDALVAKLPADAMSRADIEAAVRHALAGTKVTATLDTAS